MHNRQLGLLIISFVFSACIFIGCPNNDDPCAKGHNWDNWELTTLPNFKTETAGKETRVCSRCQEIDSRLYPVYKLGDTGPGGGVIVFIADGKGDILDDDGNYIPKPESFTFYTNGSDNKGKKVYYLEASPANLLNPNDPESAAIRWATDAYDIPNLSELRADWQLGRGKKNIDIILAHAAANGYEAPASKVCLDYKSNGKTDWYLPSKLELDEIFYFYNELHVVFTDDEPLNPNFNQDKERLRKIYDSFARTQYWTSSQYNAEMGRDRNFFSGYVFGGFKTEPRYVRAVRAF